jgi:hypothetical protein
MDIEKFHKVSPQNEKKNPCQYPALLDSGNRRAMRSEALKAIELLLQSHPGNVGMSLEEQVDAIDKESIKRACKVITENLGTSSTR